ncbi:hypothetical protein J3L16_01415 [Alteromonas sp. 5E99-2]|uniref:hypothetical protein n=1 Tax=Alteromonas sp. 5E99-2 TaxID=2817683 RepID=UPI001A997A72|nr:hypothetical protein [Alteromonas sp. 5E99-2]MBO1254338.1 hypothetical protein [Alteromonas sp. 5E99-2]
MDVSNEHLKALLEQTDRAFKELLRDPDSLILNDKYEDAKKELNSYVLSVRKHLR